MNDLELRCLIFMLDVLKVQREKLYDDLIGPDDDLIDIKVRNPDLWKGLRAKDDTALHDLYMRKYQIIWINDHWNELAKWKDSDKLSEEEKRKIVKFFGEKFIPFVKELQYFNESGIEAFFGYRNNISRTFDALINSNTSVKKILDEMELKSEDLREEFDKQIRNLKESEGN